MTHMHHQASVYYQVWEKILEDQNNINRKKTLEQVYCYSPLIPLTYYTSSIIIIIIPSFMTTQSYSRRLSLLVIQQKNIIDQAESPPNTIQQKQSLLPIMFMCEVAGYLTWSSFVIIRPTTIWSSPSTNIYWKLITYHLSNYWSALVVAR